MSNSARSPDIAPDIQMRAISDIAGISARDWDLCAGSVRTLAPQVQPLCQPSNSLQDRLAGYPANPFVSHAFLHALEASHCVGARAGWLPQHLVLEADGRLLGAAPCYLKSHSQGEY